ncbi:MAG: CoA transferase [Burkholderiaceae bacterium]|nr:CoA transferase [Burkholderiaceae bacterium]MCD8518062.1 CoA transferase [Burkholderiaceae bacterium]MCD8565137.1 CoA transferase [Burkholderiaceae bacterium]
MLTILQGVRVIDQGTYITGPATGMLLADLGAEVIKVEQPVTGDPFRAYKGELYSPHYQACNRNKRSIALDTRQPADLAVFDQLIATADVYLQNFRPGVAQKLNADEQRLRQIKPDLVYCAISGFGQDGPSASRPAYDSVAQAASGLLHLLVNPENPRVVGPALADSITGMYAAMGILAALSERARSGKGHRVEVSMLEAMSYFNIDAFTHYFSLDEIVGPYSRPRVSQSYVFECADKKWIALHMSSPQKFWDGLAEVTGMLDIFKDPRFADRQARIENQEAIIELLSPVFLTKPRAVWCNLLLAKDVPHAPVYDSSEALDDPQAKHLGLTVSGEHPKLGRFNSVRFPVSIDGQRMTSMTPPPMLDEHREEILRLIGAQ